MLCACTVDERAGYVHHLFTVVVHTQPCAVGYVGYVGDFYVFAKAVCLEALPVLGLDNHGHSFLAFADCEFGAVESAVFGRNPVKIDVESVCKFTYCHADTACSEVV